MKPWTNPYSFRPMKLSFAGEMVASITGARHEIVYEDAPILINLTAENAEVICGALNGAYNLGRNELEYENNNK